MKLRLVPVSALLILSLLTAAHGQEPNDKARKYYETLLKRPAPGAVFDRFYNAWLDSGTLEELEAFLHRTADAPDDTGAARMVLAFYYAKQNEHAKAAAEFARALERNPGSAEAWQQKALAESRLLDYTAALASLEKALAANPGKVLEAQLHQLKGRILARDGRTADALKLWQQLLAASPGDAALQEDIIELQTAEGLNKEALATAQALLAQTSDPYQKVQRRLRIGDLHARMGNREAAVAAYTECLDDTGADSWLEKEILAQIEQVFRRDDAVALLNAHFDMLLRKYPQRLSLHRRHAHLQAEKGEIDAAVQSFRTLLKLAPGDRKVREDYINLLSQNRKSAEAVSQMEELIRLQPADAELAARLTELQFEAGNAPGTIAAAELFLTKSDQSEAAFLRAAALLERCKQAAPSLALYRRTAERFPASEGAHDALALVLHRNGQKQEAVAEWRKLAAGADKSRLANVARSAAARDEHALAWELLSARAAEFQSDPVFLTQLCDEASRLEKFSDGLPYARKLVGLAKDAAAMETALTIAVRMADRAKASESLLTELASASSPQDRCLLAEMQEKAGNRPAAEAALTSIAKEAPDLAVSLQVRLFSTRGDDASAARVLQGLVESPGGQKAVHVQRLVELLTRAGKTDEALHWIPVWKKLSPGAAAPWQREAAIHLTAGRTTQSLQTLRQAAALFEDNAELKSALAIAYRNDGKYADATRLYMAMYDDAKDLPDKLRFASELARTAQAAGKTGDLIESFEARRRSNRSSVTPLLSLAEVYRNLENYEARRTVLLEAARIAPDNKALRLEIIRNAETEGDWDRAIQSLEELAATDTTGEMQTRLVSTLFSAGREQEALKLMASLATSGKVDARGAETMAGSLAAAESWPECVQLLAPVLTKYPGDYRLAFLHAVALEESGEPAAALDAFRLLVAMKDELPGGPLRSSAAQTARQWIYYGGGMNTGSWRFPTRGPGTARQYLPELDDFYQCIDRMQSAYSYRLNQNAARAFSSSPGFFRISSVTLPPSVDEVKSFAIPHLKQLTDGDVDARREVLATLESTGLRNVDLLMELSPDLNESDTDDVMELYGKYPDRIILQLILASDLIDGSRDNPPLMFELSGKLRGSHPDAARLLALNLARSTDPKHIELCLGATREIAALAGSDARARTTILSQLTRWRFNRSPYFSSANESQAPPLHQGVMEILHPHLADWYRATDPADPSRGYLFSLVTGRFIQARDFASLFKFLDLEIAGAGTGTKTTAGVTPFTRREEALISPVGFPRTGSNFPPGIAALLESNGSTSEFKGAFRPAVKEIRSLLPEVKDPALRTLLATCAGDDALTAETIPALKALEKPSLTAVMLLAGWMEKKRDFAEAAEVLKRAPHPLPAQDQLRLDGALVSWALDAVEYAGGKADGTSPLIKAAREAALRLSRIPSNWDNRKSLIAALDALGMTEDSARLLSSPDKPSLLPPAVTRSTVRSIRAQKPVPDRLETMMAAGRKADALRLLVKELKDMSRAFLNQPRLSGPLKADAWKERVSRMGLTDDLLKAVEPGDAIDATALAAWGVAQEIFYGPDKALEAYRRALAARPKSQEIFMLGLRAALKSNTQNAPSLLMQADATMLARSAKVLSEFSYTTLQTGDRIVLLEGLGNWLAALEPDTLRKEDLLWAAQWLGQFTHNVDGADDAKYGNPRGLMPDGNKYQFSTDVLQARVRWYTAARKAAALLAKNERLAGAVFSTFVELKFGLEMDPDRSVPDAMAEEILNLRLESKTTGRSSSPLFYWPPRDPETELKPNSNGIISPGEWLLQSAFLQRKPEIIAAIIPRLREAGAVIEADTLESAARLHFCADQDFAAAATETAAKALAQIPPDYSMIEKTFDVMVQRKLSADLSAPLLEAVKYRVENTGSPYVLIHKYCLYLKNAQGLGAMEDFFKRLTPLYLGPAETRAALIANPMVSRSRPKGVNMVWTSGSNPVGPPGDKVSAWAALTVALADDPHLTLGLLGLLENQFLIHSRNSGLILNQTRLGINVLSTFPFYRQPVEQIMPAFRATAALADETRFDLPLITVSSTEFPQCIFAAMRMKENVEKMRSAFAAEPQTFGTDFIQAALADSPADALLTLLGGRAEVLEKLPRARQLRIAALHRAAAVDAITQKGKSDLITKGKAWLHQVEESAALDGLEAFVAAPRASSINVSGREYGRRTLNLMMPLLRTDPEQALSLFLRVREQVAADRRAGTENEYLGSWQAGESMRSSLSIPGSVFNITTRLMDESFTAGDLKLPRTITAFAGMLGTDRGCGVEANRAAAVQLGSLLMKAGTPPGKDGKFSVQRLLETTGPVLKPEWTPVLLGAVRQAVRTTGIEKNPEALTWLEQQGKDGPHREMAMLLLTGARICQQEKDAANKMRAGIMTTELLPVEQRWLISQLEKKAVSSAALADVSADVLRAWPAAEAPLRCACVRALAAAWEADVPVEEEEDAATILESFLSLGTDHGIAGDAEFKAAAKMLSQAWLQRITNNGAHSLYGWPRTEVTDRPLVRRMLYLALSSGHPAEAGRMADAAEKSLSQQLTSAWPGMLVQFGQHDAARRLLKLPSRLLYSNDKDGTPIGWDYKAGLHGALPGFLALYENAAERFRAEVILRGLPDMAFGIVDTPLQGKIPDRSSRLLALAKAWPGDDVLKLPDAMILLARLLDVPGGVEALAPVLERMRKGAPLFSLLPPDNEQNHEATQVISALVKQSVAAGDTDPLFKFCDDVNKSRGEGSLTHTRAAMLASVLQSGLAAMKPLWPQWDEITRHKIRDNYSRLFADETLGLVMGDSSKSVPCSLYIQLYWLALVAGEEAAFDEKVRKPLKNQLSWITTHVLSLNTAATLDTLLQPWPANSPEAAQKRSEMMMEWILTGNDLPGETQLPDQWFRTVIKAGWLRAEDVLSNAEEIIAKRRREGNTATELLEIALATKRDDDARRMATVLKKRAEKDEGGVSLLLLAEALKSHSRFADALFVLDGFTTERFKDPKLSKDAVLQIRVLQGHLPIAAAAAASGIEGAVKASAALLTEKPDDPAAWEGLSWAWLYLARECAAAGNHEEALRRFHFALLAGRTAERLSSKAFGTSVTNFCATACSGELKALKRDPKLADDLKTPAGAARLADELGPRWLALPEAARKKMLE